VNDDNFFIHTIFYDKQTRQLVPAEHIPLDNSCGNKFTYEAEPIYEALSKNKFPENAWISFLSPRLYEKTKLKYRDLKDATSLLSNDTDIFLFSSHYDQATYWINPWIQGEAHHPGLMKLSKDLAMNADYDLNLETFISTLKTTVYSHYFLAKPRFWREWQRVVRIYMEMVNSSKTLMKLGTFHRGEISSIHAFVIERIPSMILANGGFESSFSVKLYEKQYPEFDAKGELLTKIENAKLQFIKDRDMRYLQEFKKLVLCFISRQDDHAKSLSESDTFD